MTDFAKHEEATRVNVEARRANSKIEDGIYLRGKNGQADTVQIHLNVASNAKGNGINLMPAEPVPDPPGTRTSLCVTVNALRRWLDAIDNRKAA